MDLNNLQYGQNNEILQFIISNGIIDINDVRNCMEDMKKEELLKQHLYEIWQKKTRSGIHICQRKVVAECLKRESLKKT